MTPRPGLPLSSALVALAGFAALEGAAATLAGGFEYPLDDVYIHLAMAFNIAHGTYGINAGEPSSAASSILYPFLLTPFAGSEAQRLLPLLWNSVAVAGSGWVWGRIVVEADLRPLAAAGFALAGPVALNISGLGFTGMEAALHLWASLGIVLGLCVFLSSGRAPRWLVPVAVLAPLLRYEGLALALGAAGVLGLRGARREGGMVAAGALGGVVAFGLFLMAEGLAPLPGSVLAKLALGGPAGDIPHRLALDVAEKLATPGGALLGTLVAAALLALILRPGFRAEPGGMLLAAVGLAGLAHLVFGRIGWLHRYEPYAVAALVAALFLAARGQFGGAMRGAAALGTLAAGLCYLPDVTQRYVWNPAAIRDQQVQMARLAQDWLKVPVAVNDIGRVAWRNPNYVLDLFGLASPEARAIRFAPTPPPTGWAGPLAARHGIKAAMIYDSWFGTAAGADWVKLAELQNPPGRAALGDCVVAIYATDPAYAETLGARLAAFAPTLPKGAVLLAPGEGRSCH